MAVTQITLTDPAAGVSSVVHPRPGIAWQGWQFDPSVRANETARTGAHGAVDVTAFYDSGAFTLSLRLYDQAKALLDELAQYQDPAARLVLTVTDDELPQQRQVTLRFDSAAKPITTGTGKMRDVALSWKAPAGVWEAAATTSYVVNGSVLSQAGLRFTSTGMRVTSTGAYFEPSAQAPPTLAVNPGALGVQWSATLYGPCAGPRLYNDTAAAAIIFSDTLVLGAGDYVTVDSAAGTATLTAGTQVSSADTYLDWLASGWWPLGQGTSQIRYAPSSASPGASAVLTFRAAWPA